VTFKGGVEKHEGQNTGHIMPLPAY